MQPFTSSIDVLDFSNKYTRLVLPLEILEVGQSFQIEKDNVTMEMLRAYLAAHMSGKLRYVALDHGTVYEVARMADGLNVNVFYSVMSKKVKPIDPIIKTVKDGKTSYENMNALLHKYIETPLNKLTNKDKMTEILKPLNIINYNFIQRNLASVASFRNSPVGSRMEFLNTISQFEKERILVELDKQSCKTLYKSGALMYKVNLQ
ncbi:MAG: hypothetical protein V4493_01095 [Pseudomonadota bacterium]